MRITLLIAVLMMAAVSSTPPKDRSLGGHRTQNSQGHRDQRTGAKRLMREKTVVADRDSKAGDDVPDRHQGKLDPTDAVPPEVHDSHDQPNDRRENGNEIGNTTSKWKTDVAIDLVG